MNKLLLILSILITNFSIESQEQRFIEIQFKFTGDCLNIGERTLIQAEVTNNNDEAFYVNTGNLFFSLSFYDQDGRPMVQIMKALPVPESIKAEDIYVLIKPKSKTKIKLKTHVFKMFDFKPNIEYTLESSYHNDYDYEGKKEATLKGVIHANLFKFKVCE